ncbi:MAG: citrate lyase subunit beta/citryl-CoA lyase [Halieaceae bacterium]|jgi:citrate lyase subunit beta/citryl-CoA lyase
MSESNLALWRSMLFVPGDNPSFLARAADRGADALILDLEDGVAPNNKMAARSLTADAVESLFARGADVLVRINDPLRLAVADLEAVVGAGLRAVVVPKAESADYLARLAILIRELEIERGLPAGGIGMIAQIESAQGLTAMDAIAATDGVIGLALGSEDLSADVGMAPLPHTLHGPAQQLVFAASRQGCMPFGFPDSIGIYTDTARLTEAVSRGREMGFRGAMAIHPAQVPIMNEHFLPTAGEIGFALRVKEALGDPANSDSGAIAVDGRMVDRPVALRAMQILEYARRFGALENG